MKLWMAPAGLHVEPATSHHVNMMVKLHTANFFHGWAANEFLNYLANPDKNPVYVACDKNNKVAGFMVLSLSGEEAELLTIIVAPRWRTKGIGNALVQAAFDDLLVSKVRAMFLEVDEENPNALALYARFGFKEVGKRPGYYPQKDGTRATALVMRCDFE